ncbi:hypothetical protein F441_17816 [Phytophthora nicotianae CJ01A1]|uniref:Uncharacterized protein n=3 Tax=Phytophthora nicotianae TaxID=4792 RepID=V9EB60_PHYNI|nr:hypothetical protein F443_17946 [Phytophthora nicotianae P1569]ETP05609.1 hypothetical protein F441_17816 [Phytophthora nicotianae CJ01A1]ETP33729.1 hypothetical protein F442_17793 [Phytophthora nicotianae P10297]
MAHGLLHTFKELGASFMLIEIVEVAAFPVATAAKIQLSEV